MAHRLLKLQLASAIRDAGWYAELEVAGDGWRADVLATSPDGAHRMAWEAQLAQITVDELRERTARMEASGVPVCWVTDHERPWIGAVPAIRLSLVDEPGPPTAVDATVIDGTGVFCESWCPRRRCENDGGAPGPCPGHGWWRPVEPGLDLRVFVAGVLAGTIRAHRTPRYSRLFTESERIVWTTRPHVITERTQLEASERRREHDGLATAEHERHLAAIAAKLARQQALTPPAVERVGREARGYVGVRDATPEWAMGVPLFVHDMPQGVISPVVSRISAEVRARLRGLTLFVATEAERRALARACGPEQRIVLFEVEIPDQPQPPAAIYSGTFWSRRQWAAAASRRTRR
ncbi:hypothetical protein [Nocardioides daphniae]|uniref:Competence protein CoiA nuclease-like domain-containing protein n=2 Tax=Nocardioides daphniae TaxID=402297 RepID=A0A4P7U7T9_9ACTN|nr:hypothetical protein [Nocardioides daphniae]QCC76056.1 hypothetical protein E2C04_00545 [Nocardioides daphniae]